MKGIATTILATVFAAAPVYAEEAHHNGGTSGATAGFTPPTVSLQKLTVS
jgi:hypothetical protein